MYFVSIVIGLILVMGSLFLIRREFMRAIDIQNQMLEQSRIYSQEDLFGLLENLQIAIDSMNQSFYEIANDLEGKYSIHEKELADLNQRMNNVSSSDHSNMATQMKSIDLSKNVVQDGNDLMIDQIEKLRLDGKTPVQIARELGIGYGELQLLMSIKK